MPDIVESPVDYLRNHKFKPHIQGNKLLYGLNSWGCDSTIVFKNDPLGFLWRFIHFRQDKAFYVNAKGAIMSILLAYDPEIIRMQIRPPDDLEGDVQEYLIALNTYLVSKGQTYDKNIVQVPRKPKPHGQNRCQDQANGLQRQETYVGPESV